MGDSINKEKVIQSLRNYCVEMETVDDCAVETIKHCISIIKSIGSYDTAPVAYGTWVHETVDSDRSITGNFMLPSCKCSVCGILVEHESDYCPHCGANMRNEFFKRTLDDKYNKFLRNGIRESDNESW